jgi:hypothetical protein
MGKPKTPPLADWEVSFFPLTDGTTPPVMLVRASHLRVCDDVIVLEDADAKPVFAAGSVRYVRVLGENERRAVAAPPADPVAAELARKVASGGQDRQTPKDPGLTAAQASVVAAAQRRRRAGGK